MHMYQIHAQGKWVVLHPYGIEYSKIQACAVVLSFGTSSHIHGVDVDNVHV